MLKAVLLGALALVPSSLGVSPSDSACATGCDDVTMTSTCDAPMYTYGVGFCSEDVMLKSDIIEVGIHKVGSYGTRHRSPPSYQSSDSAYGSSYLGFIADYGKDGWTTGTPGYSGDYFVPGAPVEGWVMQWSDEVNTHFTVNKGLMATGAAILPSSFFITSFGTTQSALWVGRQGNVQVSTITQFDSDNLYFSTSVTLKNIGDTTITDLYYMRTVDPDQAEPSTGEYATANWVEYQRFIDGDAIDRSNPSKSQECFVASTGVSNDDLYLGLGTLNSHCRANHFGFDNNDPSTLWTNANWENYDGNNRNVADEAINLMFKYDTIAAGETVQFKYSYVLSGDDLIKSMEELEYVTITQPTDIVSGSNVLFSATITDLATSGNAVDEVNFFIFAGLATGEAHSWHHIGNKAGDGGLDYFTYFNQREYADGAGQLRVEYTLADGMVYDQSIAIQIVTGLDICWVGIDTDEIYTLEVGSSNPLEVAACDPDDEDDSIASVSFFRVVTDVSEVVEKLINTDSNSPFSTDVNVDDLEHLRPVTVTAKVTLESGVEVTTTLPSQVWDPTLDPCFGTCYNDVDCRSDEWCDLPVSVRRRRLFGVMCGPGVCVSA